MRQNHSLRRLAATPPSRGRLWRALITTGWNKQLINRLAVEGMRLPLEGAGSRLRLTEGVVLLLASWTQ